MREFSITNVSNVFVIGCIVRSGQNLDEPDRRFVFKLAFLLWRLNFVREMPFRFHGLERYRSSASHEKGESYLAILDWVHDT